MTALHILIFLAGVCTGVVLMAVLQMAAETDEAMGRVSREAHR